MTRSRNDQKEALTLARIMEETTSYRCVITLKQGARHKGQPTPQVSPLRFATTEEARAFGRLIFEPQETVESWDVKQVEDPANYSYKKGELKRLQGGYNREESYAKNSLQSYAKDSLRGNIRFGR